ncbi:MAG TPA: response regulator transcription factor [Chitinophagaceae bacterium]|nr:response regulator transcription factor [Chitinophagaceae bacterium]
MDTEIRVVLVEDDVTIRNSYHYLLHGKEGIDVVNTYASCEEALETLADDAPDVILLDAGLKGISGIDGLPLLKNKVPAAHIIMLTVYEHEEAIFKALANGAAGYLTKNISPEKIVTAVRDVVESGGAMSANVARLVIQSFRKNTASSPLSRRETEVLKLIAEGKSRGRIAEELNVDPETVKTHVKNIYQKLDVHSRADAIKTAKENKFI